MDVISEDKVFNIVRWHNHDDNSDHKLQSSWPFSIFSVINEKNITTIELAVYT